MQNIKKVSCNIVKFIWDDIKIPLMIFIFFFFAGFGFYQGFMSSNVVQFVKGERVIVITTLDLSSWKYAKD